MWWNASHLSQARLLWGLACAVPAVTEDFRRRQIPNWVCLLVLAGGVALGLIQHDLPAALMGLLLGLVGPLIFYLAGGLGGGDLKLLGAYGALLGVKNIGPALFLTAVAGALLALAVCVATRNRARRVESIYYAPAIAVGTLLVLLANAVESL